MRSEPSLQFIIPTSRYGKQILRLSIHSYKLQFQQFLLTFSIDEPQALELKNEIQMRLKERALQISNSIAQLYPKTPQSTNHSLNSNVKEQEECAPYPTILEAGDCQASALPSDNISFGSHKPEIVRVLFDEKHPSLQNQSVQTEEHQSTFLSPLEPNATQELSRKSESEGRSSRENIFSTEARAHLKKKYFLCSNYMEKSSKSKSSISEASSRTKHRKKRLERISEENPSRIVNFATFHRLHQAKTQSFSHKKDPQRNSKADQELEQFEAFHLKNNIRRTSPDFFKQLHERQTKSSQRRRQKIEQMSFEHEGCVDPAMKEKERQRRTPGYVIGSHKSGFKCEMKKYIEDQARRERELREKERGIRERVRAQIREPKPTMQYEIKSRKCVKCDPQKSPPKLISPPVRINPIKDLLQESYNEFLRHLSPH